MTTPLRPFFHKPHWQQVAAPSPSRPFFGAIALGNSTQYNMAMAWKPNGELFLGIENRGCYSFAGATDPGYVKEKLGLKYEGDVAAITDLINAHFGEETEHGEYSLNFCLEGI